MSFRKLRNLSILTMTTALLFSCSQIIIREEIGKIIDTYSVNNAILYDNHATLVYETIIKENNTIKGQENSTYVFSREDKDNYYSTSERSYQGSLIENEVYYSKIEGYLKEGDIYTLKTKTNDREPVTEDIAKSDYYNKMLVFYYASYSDGKYYYGMYYGQDLIDKMAYQDNMVVNSKLKTITLTLNDINLGEGVYMDYHYTLDQYGMILDYYSKIYSSDKEIITTIQIVY